MDIGFESPESRLAVKKDIWRFINDFSPQLVLVVSGDHIYHMDYNTLIAFHGEKKAEVTICLMRVPLKDAHHFGIGEINNGGEIM